MDFKTLADLFLRYRGVVAVAVGIATITAVYGISQLGFDDNPRAVFRTDDEDFRLMEEVFEQFGTDENNSFLIVQSDAIFSRRSLTELRRLTNDVRKIGGVESAFSLISERLLIFDPFPRRLIPADLVAATDLALERASQDALEHPLVAGQLVDEQGEYALVIVRLRGDGLTISDIQPIDRRLREIAIRYSGESSLDVRVTGLPSIRVDAFTHVRQESVRFTLLCTLAAFMVAVVILRRWQMVVVVVLASLTGTLWTVGTLGLVGEDITVLTVVLPMLVMVVGFTDAIHLVVDVRHSRAAGLSPEIAACNALKHLTLACSLTSLTTAIGFASLGVTRTQIVQRFGLACGMGAVVTFMAVISIVPLLSSTRLGRGILPSRHGKRIDAGIAAIGSRLIDAVLKQRWFISIAAILLTAGMGYSVIQLEPENRIGETLPDDSESVHTLHLVDVAFGGILPSFVVVDWPKNSPPSSPKFRAALEDVHRLCEESEATRQPFSVLNVMRAIPGGNLSLVPDQELSSLLRRDKRRAVVVCRSPARGTAYYSRTFPELANRLPDLEKRHPGFRFQLTGSAVVASKNIGQMITDLATSLGLASVVIFITLTIVFRSIRIGLICLIPNALPLLLTASLLVWTGEPLRFAGVIVFCVCLGIAVDDTIHVVTRFRRELKVDGDVEAALRRSMRTVGAALVVTTLVLVAGFSVTLTSSVPGNRMFGLLSCTAITSALLGDLVILPAMLACFTSRTRQTKQPNSTDSNPTSEDSDPPTSTV